VAKRLLDYDPLTRTSVFHHYDDLTKETVIEEIQDVADYLEGNKRTQTHDVGGGGGLNEYSRKGIGGVVACRQNPQLCHSEMEKGLRGRCL